MIVTKFQLLLFITTLTLTNAFDKRCQVNRLPWSFSCSSLSCTKNLTLATPLNSQLKVKVDGNKTLEETIIQRHGEDNPVFREWTRATLTLSPHLKLQVDQKTALENRSVRKWPDGSYDLTVENVEWLDEGCPDNGMAYWKLTGEDYIKFALFKAKKDPQLDLTYTTTEKNGSLKIQFNDKEKEIVWSDGEVESNVGWKASSGNSQELVAKVTSKKEDTVVKYNGVKSIPKQDTGSGSTTITVLTCISVVLGVVLLATMILVFFLIRQHHQNAVCNDQSVVGQHSRANGGDVLKQHQEDQTNRTVEDETEQPPSVPSRPDRLPHSSSRAGTPHLSPSTSFPDKKICHVDDDDEIYINPNEVKPAQIAIMKKCGDIQGQVDHSSSWLPSPIRKGSSDSTNTHTIASPQRSTDTVHTNVSRQASNTSNNNPEDYGNHHINYGVNFSNIDHKDQKYGNMEAIEESGDYMNVGPDNMSQNQTGTYHSAMPTGPGYGPRESEIYADVAHGHPVHGHPVYQKVKVDNYDDYYAKVD